MLEVYFFMNNYEIMMNGNVKIGEAAPDFEAITTMGNMKLSDYKGKWVVLFSHPRRFYPRMYHRVYCIFKS
jgi:peroxiredoxin (alkyl hydroperoxide reductase subunit C)